MSTMDDVNRITLQYLKNSPSYQRWLDWMFNPLATPMFSMLTNPFDSVLKEWQERERR